METSIEKYNEIKSIIVRRFIIKIAGFSLLLLAGILLPAAVHAYHLFGHGAFAQQRPEEGLSLAAVAIGFLGIITSIQYLRNSMKLLKKKLNME